MSHQILLNADVKYFPKARTFIKNLLAFNREGLTVYIIYSQAQEDAQAEQFFADLVEQAAGLLEVKPLFLPTSERLKFEGGEELLDLALHLRLYPTYFGLEGRLLYLDIDILCTDVYSELFSLDLEGNSIGAVEDVYLCLCNELTQGKFFARDFHPKLVALDQQLRAEQQNSSQLVKGLRYFNSGMLLIDMAKIKEHDLWLKNLASLKEYKERFIDQTYLNVLHFNDVKYLDYKYNNLIYHILNARANFEKAGWQQLPAARAGKPDYPVFLHFAGRRKQWNSPAQEFTDAWDLFEKLSVSEILSYPVASFVNYFRELFHNYGYEPLLRDPSTLDYLTAREAKLFNWNGKPAANSAWKFNPLYLNGRLVGYHGFQKLAHKLVNWNQSALRDKSCKQAYSAGKKPELKP